MKIKETVLRGCMGAALTLLFSGGVQAAATYCDVAGSPNPDGLKYSDMTYNSANANDCYGVVAGNEPKASGDLTVGFNNLNLTWGTDWQFLAKDETDTAGSGTGTFGGINFTLSSTAGTSGSWTLTGVDTNGAGTPPDLPLFFDFVGMLKGSDSYALYLFDDVKFDGNDGGSWTISFLNNGGQIPALSHLNLYIREGDDPGQEIPEPGTLALLGLGLIGISTLRRRKN